VAFHFAGCASQGARSYQEDAAAMRVAGGEEIPIAEGHAGSAAEFTLALADGMGGHAGGALASRLACRTYLAAMAASAGNLSARLDEALARANAAIADYVAEHPALNGMGCTLVGAAFGAFGVEWVSVGDSPLYLVRLGKIELLNEDHSLAPELDKLAAAGKISRADARNDPRRHFLRSALTGSAPELVDRPQRPLRLEPDDVIVLASDGIGTLEQHEILATVEAHTSAGPAGVANALMRAVAEKGQIYQDNTTIVVVVVGAA
jgi:serine/threonine protein phosphatase PrpC